MTTQKKSTTLKSAAILTLCYMPLAAAAQSNTHSGCVNAWAQEPKTLLLSEENGCFVLKGKLATGRLAGHIVTLTGAITGATSSAPQSITVDTASGVGAVCTETCTPQPPGHRGLVKKERPGAQGGTAGRQSEPTPP